MKFCRRKRVFKLIVCWVLLGMTGYYFLENLQYIHADWRIFHQRRFAETTTRTLSTKATPTRTKADSVYPKARLVQVADSEIFIHSAFISNSTSNKVWDKIALTGWESKDLKTRDFDCCLRYKSGIVRQKSAATKAKDVIYNVQLGTVQYICDLIERYNSSDPPIGVTISQKSQIDAECPLEESSYVSLEYVYGYNEEVAVVAKIIYGNVSLPDLVAWIEIHRILGMSKVLFYSFRLEYDVNKVLQYYQSQGLAEVIPISFPKSGHEIGNIRSISTTKTFWSDEEITLLDSHERFRGYRYVILLDFDEYVIPNGNRSWVSLFDELWSTHSSAAGFTFVTYLYTTSWGVSSNESSLQIGRFFQRTGKTLDRVKYVYSPSRVKEGGLHAHKFVPENGFKIHTVPENKAVLRHYRPCRDWYEGTRTKCDDFKRYTDDSVYKRFSFIENKVKHILKEIIS